MEMSTIPSEEEWEERKRLRNQEQVRRMKRRRNTRQLSYGNDMLCFGKEYQAAWGWGLKEEDFADETTPSIVSLDEELQTDLVEVSSIPPDLAEWEKRIKMRVEGRIKRQAERPPSDYEDMLFNLGETYKSEFEKRAKKEFISIRNRYPGLRKGLPCLNSSNNKTYKQDPMSVMPHVQNNENINTDNIRCDMVSSVAVAPLERRDTVPDCIHPENPKRIRIRTVTDINSLPREIFKQLLAGGAVMSDHGAKSGQDISTNRAPLSNCVTLSKPVTFSNRVTFCE